MKRFIYGFIAWIGGVGPLVAMRYLHEALAIWLVTITGFILIGFACVKVEDVK